MIYQNVFPTFGEVVVQPVANALERNCPQWSKICNSNVLHAGVIMSVADITDQVEYFINKEIIKIVNNARGRRV